MRQDFILNILHKYTPKSIGKGNTEWLMHSSQYQAGQESANEYYIYAMQSFGGLFKPVTVQIESLYHYIGTSMLTILFYIRSLLCIVILCNWLRIYSICL